MMNESSQLLYNNFCTKIDLSLLEFDLFLSHTHKKSFFKNDHFLNEGSACKYLAFVTKGILCAYSINEDGIKHILQFPTQHYWTTDLASYFKKEKSAHSIEALSDSELILISYESFEEVCLKVPKFERFFRILFQNAIISSNSRIKEIQSDSAIFRYQTLLKNQPDLINQIPHHYIASYLGIKPQSLSRIRKDLK